MSDTDALEQLAASIKDIYGRLGMQSRRALEDRIQERLPNDRDGLSPRIPGVGSTVMGNVQPYDLFPPLNANWWFVYNTDGTLDSAWRTGDEGQASVIVHWTDGKVSSVEVSRGGRKSVTTVLWNGETLFSVTRSFSVIADPAPEEYLCMAFLNESWMPDGTFSETPTADYLAYEFM